MARTESQLEIYKIILGRKTIRQIIIEKEHIEEAIDDYNLFNCLFFQNASCNYTRYRMAY